MVNKLHRLARSSTKTNKMADNSTAENQENTNVIPQSNQEKSPEVTQDSLADKSPNFEDLLTYKSTITSPQNPIEVRDVSEAAIQNGGTGPNRKRQRQSSGNNSAESDSEMPEEPIPPSTESPAHDTNRVSWADQVNGEQGATESGNNNANVQSASNTLETSAQIRDLVPHSVWPFFTEIRNVLEKRAKSAVRLEHYQSMIENNTVVKEFHYMLRLPQGLNLKPRHRVTWEQHLETDERDKMILAKNLLKEQTTELEVTAQRLLGNFKEILNENSVEVKSQHRLFRFLGEKTSNEAAAYKLRLTAVEKKEKDAYLDIKRNTHFLSGRGPVGNTRRPAGPHSSSPRRRNQGRSGRSPVRHRHQGRNGQPNRSQSPQPSTSGYQPKTAKTQTQAQPEQREKEQEKDKETKKNSPTKEEILNRLQELERQNRELRRSPRPFQQRGRGRGSYRARGTRGGRVGRPSPRGKNHHFYQRRF